MKSRRRQFGQGMVEYTIVTSLGILVLLGPGTDVIRWTMATIKSNYQGYSYAMSLSQWPEFDIRSADPIDIASGWDPTQSSSIGETGTRGGALPVLSEPASIPNDFIVTEYRKWLVDQGVDEDRATALAGPDISSYVDTITGFYEDAFDLAGKLNPDGIKDAVSSFLPPDFDDLMGGFPPL